MERLLEEMKLHRTLVLDAMAREGLTMELAREAGIIQSAILAVEAEIKDGQTRDEHDPEFTVIAADGANNGQAASTVTTPRL